jgi:molecular chaperone DnaK
LIERNTTVPTRKSQVFSTASDNQREVEIHIVQGERPMAADNKSLGKFTLDGIPPAPRGVPQIEVTFDIDADGILKVSATDKATGRSQHITITASSGLSEEEVERMRREADAHREEDQRRREMAEARNAAENAVYAAEKALRDAGDRLPADIRSKVETRIQATRGALESENAQRVRTATNDLLQAMQEIGSSAYQQSSGPSAGGGTGPTPGGGRKPGDDVIDGQFRER